MSLITTKSTKVSLSGRLAAAVALGLLIVGSTYPGVQQAIATASCSSTADCQAKINNTDNTISSSQQQLSALAGQATTYQQTISGLQSQISDLQSQISANQAEQATLQQQIVAAQAKLDQEKTVLSDMVRTMYIDGQMSTIEELATSNNLSDYVDKEAYRQQVQVSVQDTMTKIMTMQTDLNNKKAAVDSLISEQQAQQDQLSYARQQQNSLLNYNESQQAAYNQQLASSKSDLTALKARLTALNNTADSKVIASGSCGGSYPQQAVAVYFGGGINGKYWGCSYGQDSAYDNWHMENRECVSYTAWMVHQKYGVSTYKWGNAYQWISAAQTPASRAEGITVNQTPSPGAIAIRNRDYSESGDVGHAMYVVAVNGSDSITVNEYNEHYNGTFDERTFSPSSYDNRGGMYYIHFN